MAESITHIKINNVELPIDAVSIGGKPASSFQESGKIVTSLNSSSTDEQIPSAKCLYEMIYGSGGEGAPVSNSWNRSDSWNRNTTW